MKISIVTPCFNSSATIEDTIKSVIGQDYGSIEYIIIDGGSTDNTIEIIKKFGDKISKVVSERDGGIYDAMNKGVSLATGDVVGILNSDDLYADNKVISRVANSFKDDIDACYGDLAYVDRLDISKKVRFWKAGKFSFSKIRRGWIMPHPAFFIRRELYNKFGAFNLTFKIAADYEIMLRLLLNGLKPVYIPETLVCMREGGFSAKSLRQRMAGWSELRRAWTANGKMPPLFLIPLRVLSKFSQFFV